MENNKFESQTFLSMSEASTALNCGLGKNKLLAFLRKKQILQHDNVAYPKYLIIGYFITLIKKVPNKYGIPKSFPVTLVSESGLTFIDVLLRKKDKLEEKVNIQRILGPDEMWVTEAIEIGNSVFLKNKIVKYDSSNEFSIPKWVFDMPKSKS